MEFFKTHTHINFMKLRGAAFGFSALLCIVSVLSLTIKGLQFGLDFTGGTQIEVSFDKPTPPDAIRTALESAGFSGIKVQQYGNPDDLLIRLGNRHPHSNAQGVDRQVSLKIQDILHQHDASATIKRTEFVGAEVGQQLVDQGCLAVFIAIIAIMLYIAFRFELRLALSAALGLCHDTLIVLGIFSLFGIEFDLATLASILAVIGYSLNDTIVVFDRVRENFRKIRRSTATDIMNASINQTLSRTIMTSFLTLLVILALMCFGGQSLFGFSVAFFSGILIGTYSSIFIAGAIALKLGLSKRDLMLKLNTIAEETP